MNLPDYSHRTVRTLIPRVILPRKVVTRRFNASTFVLAGATVEPTAAGVSARVSVPCAFARRMQDIESDTVYDTRRCSPDGAARPGRSGPRRAGRRSRGARTRGARRPRSAYGALPHGLSGSFRAWIRNLNPITEDLSLALCTKETAVTIPAIAVAAYGWSPRSRDTRTWLMAAAAFAAVIFAIWRIVTPTDFVTQRAGLHDVTPCHRRRPL